MCVSMCVRVSVCVCVCVQVVRAAEETAAMLALSISPDQCVKVLCPIIQSAEYPINLAAIKMQTKVIERVPPEGLGALLPEIVPGLILVSPDVTSGRQGQRRSGCQGECGVALQFIVCCRNHVRSSQRGMDGVLVMTRVLDPQLKGTGLNPQHPQVRRHPRASYNLSQTCSFILSS